MLDKLKDELFQIRDQSQTNLFTGAGIVVYRALDELPFVALGKDSIVNEDVSISSSISESSLITNKSHDGFNLVTSEFKISHKNVYFSPPIDHSIKFDLTKGYGTRYVTALMGSKLKCVLMSAVISNSYGIVIFKDGKVIFEEMTC